MSANMYVYFSENGDIMSVSASSETDLKDVQSTEIPRQDAIDFLTGTKNIHRYAIVADNETGIFRIASKENESNQLSSLRSYLSEVTHDYHNDYDIMIEHDVRRKHVRVAIGGNHSESKTRRLKTLVSNFSQLTFYFTLNGDPNMLVCSFNVPINELKKGQVFINLEHHGDELDNATLFTKRILGKYHYRKLKYT